MKGLRIMRHFNSDFSIGDGRRIAGASRAFTLIELLIVVAIIGILAAIAVPNFMNARIRAQVARTEAELRSLATAFESYRLDNNMYPPTPSTSVMVRFQRQVKLTTPIAYLSSVLLDPMYKDPDYDIPEARAYPFWDPESTDNFKTNQRYFAELPAEEARRGRWTVLGAAPDKIYLVKSNSSSLVIHYDPSNGVISDGDIVRMGP
ncbi:MAG: prepilin-type N-terminal cleavage/methylation domain-containing protein [bacterium]